MFAAHLEDARRTLWCIAAAVMGRADEADDIVQHAAVIALSKLDEFDPNTSFAAWMGQIVRYVALNARRKRKRDPVGSNAHHDMLALATAEDLSAREQSVIDQRGEVRHDQSAFDDLVLDALNQLDLTARTCLLLRTIEELPYREIAAVLDIPEGTAMSHVSRSRKRLREMLQQTFGRAIQSDSGKAGA